MVGNVFNKVLYKREINLKTIAHFQGALILN